MSTNLTPQETDAVMPIRSEATLAELLNARTTYQADLEYIGEQVAAIDAILIDRLGTVGTHQVGDVKVQVREYTRTDLAAIERDYPAGQYPGLYVTKTTIDPAAVKKAFAPDALAQYTMHGKKSIVVKP